MKKRRQILTQLLDQLKTITPTNGFTTAIGNKASYWEVYPEDYAGPATVTFYETSQETDFANAYNHVLSIDIVAIAYTNTANRLTDSSNLLDDLYRAVIEENWCDPGVIVRPVATEKEIEGKGKQAIKMTLTIEVEFRD